MNRFGLRINLFKFKTLGKLLIHLEKFTKCSSIFINPNRKISVGMEPVGLGNTRISNDCANEEDEPVEYEK
jgi:hypothetical protein